MYLIHRRWYCVVRLWASGDGLVCCDCAESIGAESFHDKCVVAELPTAETVCSSTSIWSIWQDKSNRVTSLSLGLIRPSADWEQTTITEQQTAMRSKTYIHIDVCALWSEIPRKWSRAKLPRSLSYLHQRRLSSSRYYYCQLLQSFGTKQQKQQRQRQTQEKKRNKQIR